MTIYRYTLRGPSVPQIQRRIRTDFSSTLGPIGPVEVRDVELTGPTGATAIAASKEDLDEYMSLMGWDFLSTDPTLPVPGNGSMLAWGNQSVGGTIALRYLDPWGAQNQIAGTDGTTNARTVVTRGGTIGRLYVRHGNPDGNGNDVTYTVRVNGVTTAIAVTLASTDGQASNLVDNVVVVTGDNVDIEISKPGGGIGNSPDGVTAQVGFV